MKKIDSVARFGGDEFVILLEEDKPEMINHADRKMYEDKKKKGSQ